MSVDPNELLALPAAEKMRLIEMLWNDLEHSTEPIPLPEWIAEEAVRRRDEMLGDPNLGISREEAWKQIREGDG
jgi:putative addiction module component (TIGR02574 family)